MQKYIVIADDLTGSNATCSLFKKIGLRAASILKLQGDINYDVDVISYSTASRGLDKEEAYKKVSEAIKILKNKDVLVYNKRIDSTLRGNIGTEINAMLDNLEDDRIAVVIPSYPDSGRIVVNKTMLVNGVLLENSDAGKDPKTPIKTSCVESLIQKGIKYSSTYFTLSDIEQPIEEIVKKIQEAIKKSRVLIFDAVNNEDIIKISKAIIHSDIDIVTVDPGPFTLYYSKELQKKNHLEKKILMVIGSVTATTKKQIEYILQEEDIFLVKMKVEDFFEKETCLKEIERVIAYIKKGIASYDLFLVTTSPIGDEKKADLQKLAENLNTTVEEISKIIANTLTETIVKILKETQKFEGIYSSGGDITIALLEKLKAIGVEIREEVIPLAAYGRIIGGDFPNLKLVSKGGMVGDEKTIKLCLHKIKNDI
ncbi:four-carbon acid sugar kinase family protein [Fusobacterium polymorphum]|uniref:four-carbon acid sugar kinase family protein n=1 Tax=Fusobacterium nucleatum subsp. polymorphum TaxID=76857 RepID=UPI002926D467|nr:four-carbon acid sugar kinase family protein [Fusobacterium polymorphum]WRL75514.1 four-carbon acid sugar kinase family protein [Fusobacterium polymorphum]BEO97648.1 four-carbon acid sugar kinase family protein [Fusobacterium nucleatum]BEP07668.1 four-carbon acid sugar kinase family protein [Fusobacterium nucleatum]